MIWLVLGLALWIAGHGARRFAPDLRTRAGNAGRGIAAAVILAGVVLMVLGYRWSDFVPVYEPPLWTRHLNNLLMLFAVYLFAVSGARTWLHRKMRHPMLTGLLVWAVAHLLVNGDAASLVLFGTLGIWSVAEMLVINRAAPHWEPPAPRPASAEIRAVVITLVVYVVIGLVHGWIGPSPFMR